MEITHAFLDLHRKPSHARECSVSQTCFVRSRAHSLSIASRQQACMQILHCPRAWPRTQTERNSNFGKLLTMRLLVRTVNWHSWRRRFAGQFGHTRLSTLRCMFRITTLHTIINESAPSIPWRRRLIVGIRGIMNIVQKYLHLQTQNAVQQRRLSRGDRHSTIVLERLFVLIVKQIHPKCKTSPLPPPQNWTITSTDSGCPKKHALPTCWPSARPFGTSTSIEQSQTTVASAKHRPPSQT